MSNGRTHKRVDESKRRSAAGVIAAAVAGLVLVGGAASGIVFALKGDEPAPVEAVEASAPPTPSASDVAQEPEGDASEEPGSDESDESDPVSDDARSSCVAQLESAEAVVRAARPGIRHLKLHVDAHQAWVDGRISEEKKSAQYKRTRLLGPGDIDRYQAATASYASLEVDDACESLGKPCRRRMQAITTSMEAAERGMSHWEEHLTNMADFAAGKFDAATANELWNETRAQMPAMTKPWDDAERALDRAPSCT